MWVDLLGGRFLTMGLGHIPGVWSGSSESIHYYGILCSALIQWRGGWYCLNFVDYPRELLPLWGLGEGAMGHRWGIGLWEWGIIKKNLPVKSFKENELENNWGDRLLRNQSKDQSIKGYSSWNNYTDGSMECVYRNLLTMMGHITTFAKPSLTSFKMLPTHFWLNSMH